MPKTTCPEHRRKGYYLNAGTWLCKGCHQPEAAHETTTETIARNSR